MLLPQRQQTLTVCVIAHDGLAVIATLNHMMRIACDGQAGLAGHEETPEMRGPV
jgi:hypothetical protein